MRIKTIIKLIKKLKKSGKYNNNLNIKCDHKNLTLFDNRKNDVWNIHTYNNKGERIKLEKSNGYCKIWEYDEDEQCISIMLQYQIK